MKKMLKPFAMLLCIAALGLTASCSKDDDDNASILGKWMRTRYVEGMSTKDGVIATLEDIGYVDEEGWYSLWGAEIETKEYNTKDAPIYEFTADGYLTITYPEDYEDNLREYKYEMKNGGITVYDSYGREEEWSFPTVTITSSHMTFEEWGDKEKYTVYKYNGSYVPVGEIDVWYCLREDFKRI